METKPSWPEKIGDSLSRLIGGFATGVDLLTQAPGFVFNTASDAWLLTRTLWDKMVHAAPEENLLIYLGLPSHLDIADPKEREKAIIRDRLERLEGKLKELYQDADFMAKYYESASLLATIRILDEQKTERLARLSNLKAQRASIMSRKDFSTDPMGNVEGLSFDMTAADIMVMRRTASLSTNTELTAIDKQIAQLEDLNACKIPWPEFEFDTTTQTIKEKPLPPGKTAPETKSLLARFNEISTDLMYQKKLGELKLYLVEAERNTLRLDTLNRVAKHVSTGGGDDGEEETAPVVPDIPPAPRPAPTPGPAPLDPTTI